MVALDEADKEEAEGGLTDCHSNDEPDITELVKANRFLTRFWRTSA